MNSDNSLFDILPNCKIKKVSSMLRITLFHLYNSSITKRKSYTEFLGHFIGVERKGPYTQIKPMLHC